MRPGTITGLVASAALLLAPVIRAQTAVDGRGDATEVVDVFTGDTAQEGVKEFGEACRQNARELETLRSAVATRASQPGLDPARVTQGRVLEKEGAQAVAQSSRLARWAHNAGRLMNAIDVVSPLARTAGRLYEGDRPGAMSELASEGLKKVEVAIGTTGGSIVPGGSIAGAAAAEWAHDRYVKPAIERAADQQREQEARERLLGPNIPGEQVIGPDGRVRTLPPDMYVDRETGNVRQRSPEEQRDYERQWRDDRRRAKESIHPLDRAAEDLREGRIDQDEFDRRVAEYNRDHGRQDAEDADAADADTDAGAAQEDGTPDEGAPPEVAGPRDILSLVAPVQITAMGVERTDASAGEFRNIVTSTFTLRFWNVGALAPGYERATMTVKSVASLNGAEETTTCGGTFSGGPNGSFHLTCDGEARSLRLVGGAQVSTGGPTLAVSNPQAFANWPKY